MLKDLSRGFEKFAEKNFTVVNEESAKRGYFVGSMIFSIQEIPVEDNLNSTNSIVS